MLVSDNRDRNVNLFMDLVVLCLISYLWQMYVKMCKHTRGGKNEKKSVILFVFIKNKVCFLSCRTGKRRHLSFNYRTDLKNGLFMKVGLFILCYMNAVYLS